MRKIFIEIAILTILIFTAITATISEDRSYREVLQDGDIIFQTSTSSQSIAIELATKSNITHCGIIVKDNGKFYVYEASSKVKLTPVDNWIDRGKDSSFTVKRLKNRVLSKNDLDKMSAVALHFKDKKYDPLFKWSDDTIYCSELVRKIYEKALHIKLGELVPMSSFDFSSNEVMKIIDERYIDGVNQEEPVISPVSIFNSRHLETVVER